MKPGDISIYDERILGILLIVEENQVWRRTQYYNCFHHDKYRIDKTQIRLI